MKPALLVLATLLPGVALAQTAPGAKPAPRPATVEAIQAFAVRAPDEGSPFFSEREEAQALLNGGPSEAQVQQQMAVYPKVRNSPDSAPAILGRFFSDMFSSVHFGKLTSAPTTEDLKVIPAEFSLKDKRELDTTYTVRNNTGKMMRLDYTTSQRMDITTRDGAGNVIDRWSEDRAFKPQQGIIIINPKERIEYNETVPTRDMKPNQSYTIQADVTGYPDYTATKTVTTQP